MPIPISISEIKDLYQVYECPLELEYLADLVNSIDESYITERVNINNKQASQS